MSCAMEMGLAVHGGAIAVTRAAEVGFDGRGRPEVSNAEW
jgi:hypothetical protein